MDQTTILLLLVGAAVLGIVATILILRRDRTEAEDAARESPFATSTEGMQRCPDCGAGNLVASRDCSECGRKLPG